MIITIPISSRRGQPFQVRMSDDAPGDKPYAVGIFPIGSDTGICIGTGRSGLFALGDALDTLQAGCWSLQDAIVEVGKHGGRGGTGT